MADPGSISQCIAEVHESGSAAALERICNRYYEQLASIASRHLRSASGRIADEHAVANQALFEFFDRSTKGHFAEVQSRGELLPLLIRLTRDRVIDEIRRLTAAKRGAGKTRGHSIFVSNGNQTGGFDTFSAPYDHPSTREIVKEELTRIMDRLPDQATRTILVLRSEGYKDKEIAKELNVSLATVERKRRRIRDILADLET